MVMSFLERLDFSGRAARRPARGRETQVARDLLKWCRRPDARPQAAARHDRRGTGRAVYATTDITDESRAAMIEGFVKPPVAASSATSPA
jgi:hypothetical protein